MSLRRPRAGAAPHDEGPAIVITSAARMLEPKACTPLQSEERAEDRIEASPWHARSTAAPSNTDLEHFGKTRRSSPCAFGPQGFVDANRSAGASRMSSEVARA